MRTKAAEDGLRPRPKRETLTEERICVKAVALGFGFLWRRAEIMIRDSWRLSLRGRRKKQRRGKRRDSRPDDRADMGRTGAAPLLKTEDGELLEREAIAS